MTRAEKIKQLCLIAEGLKTADDLKNEKVYMWDNMEDPDMYKTVVDGHPFKLTEKEFKTYCKKVGGQHLIITCPDDDAEEPTRFTNPLPAAIPETVTMQAEVVDKPEVSKTPVQAEIISTPEEPATKFRGNETITPIEWLNEPFDIDHIFRR